MKGVPSTKKSSTEKEQPTKILSMMEKAKLEKKKKQKEKRMELIDNYKHFKGKLDPSLSNHKRNLSF